MGNLKKKTVLILVNNAMDMISADKDTPPAFVEAIKEIRGVQLDSAEVTQLTDAHGEISWGTEGQTAYLRSKEGVFIQVLNGEGRLRTIVIL